MLYMYSNLKNVQEVDSDVNHGVWVILMCHCGLTSYDKCTILSGDTENRGGHAYTEMVDLWEIVVPLILKSTL